MTLLSFNGIAGDVIYVKSDASGAGDGTSWTDAFTDLQSALDTAASGDEIWVAAGTYYPSKEKSGNDSTSRYYTFHMVEGTSLYGGFEGNESSVFDRDWESFETILSGDIGVLNDISDNCYTVVTGSSNITIDGFTITQGNSNSTAISTETDLGGGILNNSISNVSILHCKINDNNANGGAGIANYYCTSAIEIKECIFNADTAGQAGAIGNWNCKAYISKSLFTDNNASNDYGSAIYNWGSGSTSEITECTFYGNSTPGSGGTVHSRGVTASIKNVIFWGNGSDDIAASSGGSNTVTYSLVPQSGYAGSNGNISDDPLFVDPANNYFQLSTVTSPAVDAGDPNSEYDPDSTVADMGAYPFFQTNGTTNTGIAELISPESTTTAGINRFVMTFTNYGTEDISSVQIGMKIEDSVYVDYEWTGDLLSGQTSKEIPLGYFSIPSGNPDVKIWTEAPNGSADDYVLNDTLVASIQFNTTPMAGEYIVGIYPSDFEEINHAAMHLMENGVDDAVTINIKPGTYDDQVMIGSITGASAANTITFQSLEEDSTTVDLTYSPISSDDNFTMRLDQASYVIIQHLTIRSEGTSSLGRVIEVKNGIDNCQFKSNRIIGIETSDGENELLFSAGGTSGGSENDIITVENNYFQYGKYGIRYRGWGAATGDDVKILNNQFKDQYYGINARSLDNLQINENQITMNNPYYSNWGIDLVYCDNNVVISGNKISITANSAYGIIFETESSPGTGSLIHNNFIHIEPGGTGRGIVFHNTTSPSKIYFNSVNVTGNSDGAVGLYFSDSPNKSIINNISANVAGGKAIEYYSSSSLSADYNNYFTTGSILGSSDGTDAADLATWQTNSGQDLNSVSIRPYFKSDEDLHTTYGLLDNLGTPLGDVTADIDGEARDGTNPDMGADEFSAPGNDMAVVDLLSPVSGCGLTNAETVSLRITNVGASSQSDIPLKFSVDEGQTILGPETLAGPVDPGDTVTFTFTANKADLSIPGIYEVGVALSDAGDANQDDDTLFFTITHYPIVNTFPFTEDFEAGDETFSLQYEVDTYALTEIEEKAGNDSTYGLKMGSWTSGIAFNTNANEVWTANTGQYAKAYTCSVDLTGLSNPRLKLDLRQTNYTGQSTGTPYSWFRILVDDTQISDIYGKSNFTPLVPNGDWDTVYFDLNAYTGSDFTLTMQSACRSPGSPSSEFGDNVFVDNIIIGDAPVVNLGNDQFVCLGETVNLDAGSGAGYSYDWRKLSTGEKLAITQTLDVTTDGEYLVIVTNSLGFFDSDTVKVTFSQPVANAGTDQSVCYGDTAVLESVTEWTGYEWETGETTRIIEYIVTKDSVFTLTVTDSLGCTDEDEVAVTMLSLPDIDLGEDVYKCPEDVHTLDAGTGYYYLWSDASTNQRLHVTGEDTYWVEITDLNGCKNRDTVDVYNYASPVVNLGSDTTVCPGDSVVFDAGEGFVSYSWSNSATTQTIEVAQPNTYSVTVTDDHGCAGKDTVVLSNYSQPVVDLGTDQTICKGDTTILDAGAGFTSYLWSNGLTTQTVDTDTAGLFSVTVTDANGCKDTDEKIVSIYPEYPVDLGDDLGICQGDSILLDPAGITGYSYQSYSWSDGSTTSTIYVKEAGSYSIAAVDINGCNARGDTVVVTVNPVPVLDLGPDLEGCSGEYLTIDPGAGYATYNWNDGISSTQTYEAYYTGSYTLKVTNEYGCSVTDTISVTYHDPQAVELGPNVYICVGDETTLDAGAGFASYLWSDESTTQTLTVDSAGTYSVEVVDENGCTNSDDITVYNYPEPDAYLGEDRGFCSGSSILIEPNVAESYIWSDGSTERYLEVDSAGTYWIKVTNSYGCEASDTIVIVEYPSPDVSLGSDTAYCDPGTAFTLDAGSGWASYVWSDQSTGQTLYVYNSGEYSVRVTNEYGCTGSDTVDITVYPLPVVNLWFEEDSLFTYYTGGVEYVWYLDDEVLTGISSTSYVPDQTGDYKVYVTDTNGCSSMSNEQFVEIISVGIDEFFTDNLVEIYPNPTTGKFIVKFPDEPTSAEIRIFNMVGTLVFREKIERLPHNYEKPVDLNHLTKGIYLIRVDLGERWDLMKLVVE